MDWKYKHFHQQRSFPASRDAVVEASRRLNIDDSAFLQLLDVRAKKHDRWELRVKDVAARYLKAIGEVVAAVDTMQSPGT